MASTTTTSRDSKLEVTLWDGTPLTPEQVTLLEEYWKLLEATIADGKLHSKCKKHPEEATLAAAWLNAADEKGEWMRAFLTPQCVRRYLVANQWVLRPAYENLLRTLHWRCHNVPMKPETLHNHLVCVNTRYMEWVSFDRSGKPIMFIKSRNADLEISREDRTRFMIFAMELGTRLMRPQYSSRDGVERWNMVVDETGKEWKHMDNGFLSSVTPVVFANYVEHLNRCYIINPGGLTSMAISVVKLFLDDRTKEKMCQVHAKKCESGILATDLVEQLGAENVPVSYGGTLKDETAAEYFDRVKSV